mgnify:FL=1
MKKKANDNVIKMQAPDRSMVSRTLLMAVFGIVAFTLLAARLYKVQIIDHDMYESSAVEQQVRDTTLTASRGTIYDSNMKILAMSATVSTVYISPAELIKYEETDMKSMISSRLSEILGVSYDDIMKKWDDTASWYKTVAVKIESDLADQVRDFKNEYDLKSVHIVPDTKRYYPYSNLASQIIGFVGTENTGLEGVEAVYDSYLEGVNGRIVKLTAENGVDLPYTGYENYFDATDGKSLVLTVDSTIQYYLEKNLAQAIDDYQVQNGAMGIVMDVKTGAILAMTSLPDYDLNNCFKVSDDTLAKLDEQELSEEEYDEQVTAALLKQWRNRIISDTYEPGSTFKIITLAMGLEEGVISEDDTFFCGGNMEVKGRTEPLWCWNHGGHGQQTLAEAAQHSCNVAFVNIGLKMGAKKFYDYIDAFGFFDKTGVDLYGEGDSIWWSDDVFEDPQNFSQLAAASFGQTFNITPIQLITAVSAVANGGYLMKPYVVSKVLDEEGNLVENREPTVVRQVISEETSRRARDILESVVKVGTGKNAYVAGYRIAGKTGTSVDTTTEASTGEKKYKVSFIGFAPADDPQIAVLIILDSPSKSSGIYISGGVMAAPVVGKIMNDVLPCVGVQQDLGEDEGASSDVKMPNLKGGLVADAKQDLESLGLNVRVVGNGTAVSDQAPAANVTIAQGSTVILYAGESKPTETVIVPALNGMSFRQAKAALEDAGLFIRSVGVAPSDSYTIVVASQGTSAESEVAYGSVIQVTLIDNDSKSTGEGA